jgi:hypothetical protein
MLCFLHITSRNVWASINRSDARVWDLSWSFLAHIEHICDPPTLSLTLFAWDCILVRDWVFLVHLHQLVIFEALGGTPSKCHRLGTLRVCGLLDGLVVFLSSSPWRLWRSHGGGYEGFTPTSPDRQSRKGDTSGTEILSDSLFLGSKIKSCLDRRASENLKSTSTWITVIGKSLIPREKFWCLFFSLTCLNCK